MSGLVVAAVGGPLAIAVAGAIAAHWALNAGQVKAAADQGNGIFHQVKLYAPCG